jgi:Cof subfamily protein (haloacid dehalogenase superfamily)
MNFDLERVKLVATDLDGTLLRSDGSVSARTIRALENVSTLGITVVLVTARPPRFVQRLANRFTFESVLALCCNGALAYDLVKGTIVRHQSLDVAVATRLSRDLRTRIPGTCFAVEMGLTYGWEPEYAAMDDALIETGGNESDFTSLINGPVTKLIARHSTLSAAELLPLAQGIVGDAAVVTHSGTSFVEISAPGVEKAAALADVVKALGIKASEVLAFGDMPNDLTLLRWAGTSVAMSNAHPEVVASADYVTLTNEDDGVADVLERITMSAENQGNEVTFGQ